jgi:hypothetical protein
MPFVTVCVPVQTCTSSTTSSIWPYWHNNIITSGTTTFTSCTTSSTGNIYNDVANWPTWQSQIIELTEEQAAQFQAEVDRINRERELRIQEDRERARIQQEAQEEINKKAKEILLDHLTSKQRETIEKFGWFIIKGGKSNKEYWVDTKGGISGNIKELDEKGIVIARYCCHLPHSYPTHDHHLTQILMLEWDEDEFLKKANKTVVA